MTPPLRLPDKTQFGWQKEGVIMVPLKVCDLTPAFQSVESESESDVSDYDDIDETDKSEQVDTSSDCESKIKHSEEHNFFCSIDYL